MRMYWEWSIGLLSEICMTDDADPTTLPGDTVQSHHVSYCLLLDKQFITSFMPDQAYAPVVVALT